MKALHKTLLGIAAAASISTGTLLVEKQVRDQPPPKMTSWGVPWAPCAWCGGTKDVNVHHIVPQHVRPDLARDTNNMVCLDRNCHFVLGHRCNWRNSVTNVLRMIEEGKK